MRCQNPFAFRPGPVSFWTTVIYLALVIPLIYVHETVPPAPSDRSLYQGLNLTEAWLDLQTISRAFHPYNSHENDVVRQFLIDRTKEILDRNSMPYTTETIGGVDWHTRCVLIAHVDKDTKTNISQGHFCANSRFGSQSSR